MQFRPIFAPMAAPAAFAGRGSPLTAGRMLWVRAKAETNLIILLEKSASRGQSKGTAAASGIGFQPNARQSQV
jgi:hypothetical protein